MDHFLQEENKGQNRPLEPVRVARQRERDTSILKFLLISNFGQ